MFCAWGNVVLNFYAESVIVNLFIKESFVHALIGSDEAKINVLFRYTLNAHMHLIHTTPGTR